jgi:alpha-D-ribose 1-methylphosphonate 5-triphosphate synthase subunit PhnL
MLNQAQTMHVIMHTETEAGHKFTVVFIKAFQALLEHYLVNRPKFEVVKRENLGTGIYDQLQEEKAAHLITKDRLANALSQLDPASFSRGSFDACREITRAPGSKRSRAGHAGKVTRMVVNSVVQ